MDNVETAGLAVPTTAEVVTTSAVQAAVSTVAVPKNASKAADAVITSAVQADVSAVAAPKLPVMAQLERDEVDTAE